MAQSDICNKSA